ncbi:hypothetical protein STIUS_v1c05660 [Spiroplasma sp. TIUS-1]|uniref:hypothetical protein n=1 Tax=Spiroplasma sp. TIUS-1 TaxID=216963 RepID=UPI001397824E|nr:hypothetical protein [Spiroplasma sp. TIUS-1]QHX36120.1 hypothetical protein STIUS_v1c05660 [Spiroplasma sp. TIUS-1]
MNYEHKIKLEDENRTLEDSLKVVNNNGKIRFGIVYVNYVFNNDEKNAHYKIFVKPAINREADNFKEQTYQFTYDNFRTNIINGDSPNFLFSKGTPYKSIEIPYEKVVNNKIDIGVRTVVDGKNEIAFASIDLTPIYKDNQLVNFVYGDRPKMIKESTLDTKIVRTNFANYKFNINQINKYKEGYSPKFEFNNEIEYVQFEYGNYDDVSWRNISKPLLTITETIATGVVVNKSSIKSEVVSYNDKFEDNYEDVLNFQVNQVGKNTIFESKFSTRYDDQKHMVVNDKNNAQNFIVKNPKAHINSDIKYDIQIGAIHYSALSNLNYESRVDAMLSNSAKGILIEQTKYVWKRTNLTNLDFGDDKKIKEIIMNAKESIN